MLRRLETIIVAAGLIVALALVVEAWAAVVVYSPSPSLRHHLFVRTFRSPRVGDFVVFCAPAGASRLLREHGYPSHPRCPDGRVRLVKRTASVRGGEVFVLGSHPHSVDSRRLGWISVSELFTVAALDAAEEGGER